MDRIMGLQLAADGLLRKNQNQVYDSQKQLEKLEREIQEQKQLVDIADCVLGTDDAIERQISKKFQNFESDGESDARDLDERFENFCI